MTATAAAAAIATTTETDMGRKAPIGKSKVITTGSKVLGPGTVKSQGGVPARGRIDRGGSNAGRGNKNGGSIVRSDKGSNY